MSYHSESAGEQDIDDSYYESSKFILGKVNRILFLFLVCSLSIYIIAILIKPCLLLSFLLIEFNEQIFVGR